MSKVQALCHWEFCTDFSVQLNLSYVNFTGDVDAIVAVKDRTNLFDPPRFPRREKGVVSHTRLSDIFFLACLFRFLV